MAWIALSSTLRSREGHTLEGGEDVLVRVIAHHGGLDKGVRIIQKPFSLRDLATKVRSAFYKTRCISFESEKK